MTTSFRIVPRSFVGNRARVVAAAVVLGCAGHLSVPLNSQSTWGANPTWAPAGTNVGIGTSTPTFALDINTWCDTLLRILTGGGLISYIGQANGLWGSAGPTDLGMYLASNLYIGSGAGIKMTVTNAGNVG